MNFHKPQSKSYFKASMVFAGFLMACLIVGEAFANLLMWIIAL